MKKLTGILLVMTMVFGLTACGNASKKGSNVTETKRIPYLINRSGFNFRVDIFLNGILCKSSWNHPNGHKKPHTNRPSRTPARIRKPVI